MISTLVKKLERDAIKISSRSFIDMSKFLSFLTIEVKSCKGFLGESTGWTQYAGPDNLIIKGGKCHGGEWLDSIQYKEKLSDSYSNFVNPFYIWEILNKEGREFFINFYKEDILTILNSARDERLYAQKYERELKLNFEQLKALAND